jgi:flagellar motility protein MotE (MotC chaperone)
MIGRLRLIDSVAIAAGAMLVLKVLGIATGSLASDARRPPVRMETDEPRPFADVLARARTNFVPEVKTTGTLSKEEPKGEAKGNGKPPGPAPAPPAPAAADRPPLPESPSERALLERLGERRQEMQLKSKDLDLRERMLEDAERKLEARLNELKTIEQKAETEKSGDQDAGSLKNLVIMYEAMKPKDAARVFDRLSHDVLVPVVLQMNPRKMAEVLAVMSPEAAERLTVALALRAKGKTEAAPAGKTATALPPNELPAIDPAAPRR